MMPALFNSVEFWAGAVVITLYQSTKFGELSAVDSDIRRRIIQIPNLRAFDFASRNAFFFSFFLFLIASFWVYWGVCALPKAFVQSLIELFGGDKTNNAVESKSYPIYVASLYIVLTQKEVPLFASIINMQRSVFHYWIGVPDKVVDAADYFSNQIVSKFQSDDELREFARKITSDEWIRRIDRFADAIFYRSQIDQLKLTKPLSVSNATILSRDDLSDIIERAVLLACIATVHESGGRRISDLAAELGVETKAQSPRRASARPLLAAILLFLISVPVLVEILIYLREYATFINIPETKSRWASDRDYAVLYIFSYVFPVFIGCLFLFITHPFDPESDAELSFNRITSNWKRYSVSIFFVIVFVVLFDLSKEIMEYSYNERSVVSSPLEFFGSRAIIYLAHALVVSLICFFTISFFRDRVISEQTIPRATFLAVLPIAAAAVSTFYTSSFLSIFDNPGRDMYLLVAFLSAVAALTAIVTAFIFYRPIKSSNNK